MKKSSYYLVNAAGLSTADLASRYKRALLGTEATAGKRIKPEDQSVNLSTLDKMALEE